MTVALVANIARPISSAISTAFSADSYGALSSYGLIGGSTNPDSVIEALFANSEQGAWYDQSDLTTMFQDRAGTTPVTADGQTVGLILDKSKGLVLGSELSPAISTWNTQTGVSKSGETLVFTNAPLDQSGYCIVDFDPAKRYKITFRIASISSGSLSALLGNYATKNYDSPGTYVLFTTNDLSDYIQIQSKSESTNAVVDLVSVKELAGNHAIAPSDAARPLYKTSGGLHWMQFDGVDDRLDVPLSVLTGVTQATATYGAYYTAASGSNGAVLQGFGSAASQGHEPYTGGDFYCNFANATRPLLGNVPTTTKLVTTLNQSTSSLNYRRNAVDITTNATGFSKGTSSFGIGASADFGAGWNGNVYSIIIRGALSTTQEITDTETWVNGKTGAY